MKILFAVSNENVSKRIVENYQEKYGESVSFKNVFYFNAIIREIKNDKTYDRIVISEDLEPFANSNYDVIDKFILERLNEISNETNALEKIPDIIIICTDRRTKSGYVLTKMHEYGIYNALVGTDRKIDAVCELLNRPRNSEEAKEYYQIAGTTVDTSSVDDVTEQEVQNILIHYKRLGKNEDRYTDSFNNIAAQYTDKQLKIIIKCLPINVRAVLEAECPKYQELVTYADETDEERKAKEKLQEQRRIEQIENDRKLKQKIEKEKKEAFKNAQKENNKPIQENKPHLNSGIDLLDNKNTQTRMTGNVIIPNNMDIKNERKIYSDEELQNINSMPREGRMGNTEIPQNADTYNNQPQTESMSELENWDRDPFAETTANETPQAQTDALPGLESWDQDPFAETTNEATQTQTDTLPGLESWDQDPFAETTNEVPQTQTDTLPGLESWDQDPFAETTNEAPQTQTDTLPGLESWDQDPFAETTNEAPQTQTDTLPGLESWDQDPFANTNNNAQSQTGQSIENFTNQATELENQVLPGIENIDAQNQSTETNVLPGIDDWDKDPFADINIEPRPSEVQNYEDSFNISETNTIDSLTLPGLDDMSENLDTENIESSETTLPGIENTTLNQNENQITETSNINKTVNVNGIDMFAQLDQTLNETNNMAQGNSEIQTGSTIEPQLQMPDVSVVPEIPQEPKRGRGRPRKYPIEPPKPKGKRGRPRKYPLPEEANTENQALQAVQNSMVEVPETLPPQVTNQNIANSNVAPIINAQVTEQPISNQNYAEQNNTQINNQAYTQQNAPEQSQINNQEYAQQNTQVQPQVNNQEYAQSNVPVQPQVNNQAYVQQNIPAQPQVNNQTYAQQNVQVQPQVNNQAYAQPNVPVQQTNNQPYGMQQNETPQTINTQYVNQNVELNNQFNPNSEQLNNQENEYNQVNQTQTDPLAEFNDLDTSINQNVAETNSLPGLNDWDTDPLEENNWNRDPFEENNDTLPGIDNSVGYSLENSEDTLSSSVVNPYNTNQYEDTVSNQMTEQNNYTQTYQNQTNPEYTQNNNYNQYDNFSTTQTMAGFGIANNNEQVTSYTPSQERRESLQKIEENKSYSTGSLNSILTRDKKIVAFVGASKSGTSFLVNNLACLFSSIGVKTAILDMTQNKNSYFIYTNNEEDLRNVAYSSIENLEKGYAQGIPVDRNLNVYTTIPNDGKDYSNAEAILSTLVQNESLILLDCDFDTDLGYLANAQEIYLVQSMDILTIQPLTAFLRDLKTKGILDQEKLRIVINKETKVRGLSSKAIIGGISFYNDPAMSYMTELFNKDKVKACSIPFDEGVYSKYLESVVNCSITISGYNKNFMNSLKMLGNMVYPLLSKQTYGSKSSAEANYGNNFSTEMNNTLNQMKNKY